MLKRFFTTLTLVLFTAHGVSAQAIQVPAGQEREINAHGTCRVIVNKGTQGIMVATRTAQEWSVGGNAFLTNIADIPKVSAESCIKTAKTIYAVAWACVHQGVSQCRDARFAYSNNDTIRYQNNTSLDLHGGRIRFSDAITSRETTCVIDQSAAPLTVRVTDSVPEYERYSELNAVLFTNQKWAPPAGQTSCYVANAYQSGTRPSNEVAYFSLVYMEF